MRHFLTFILSFVVITLSFSQTITIEHINIIDVRNGEILSDQHVLIRKDIIQKISKSSFKNVDTRIDGKGKFLIPGLWDMHVHLSMVGEASLPLFVANGVTGVRDMGGDWNKLKEWRSISEDPEQSTLPVIKSAGPILESGRFYDLLQQLLGTPFVQNRIPVRNPSMVDLIIDSVANLGVDFIKIRTASSPETFYSLLRSTQRHNIPISGHIDNPIEIDEAIEAGIATIEHDLFLQVLSFSETDKNKVLNLIGKRKPYFTPTIIATNQSRLTTGERLKELLDDSTNQLHELRKYISPGLIENWKIENRLKALESPLPWDSIVGVSRDFSVELAKRTKVLSGTDVGVLGIYPGWSLHTELQNLANDFQFSPLQALQSATINATECLQLSDQYGTIEAGKKADFLILRNNPLNDISYTQEIEMVFKNGIPISGEMRRGILSTVEKKVAREKKVFQPKNLRHLNAALKSMGLE